mgnify:CR=1 FL=1
MKIKLVRLLIIVSSILLTSCMNIENDSNTEKKLNEIGDNQNLILKKIASLEKSISNLALANKTKPADNKKQQPPQADPNKVYNIPIGDSFSKGPDNAAVTIIEWSDFQ